MPSSSATALQTFPGACESNTTVKGEKKINVSRSAASATFAALARCSEPRNDLVATIFGAGNMIGGGGGSPPHRRQMRGPWEVGWHTAYTGLRGTVFISHAHAIHCAPAQRVLGSSRSRTTMTEPRARHGSGSKHASGFAQAQHGRPCHWEAAGKQPSEDSPGE
ncbi:hypothetical protein FQR65_LT20613 [Abscondita terminalis]|nr:hypothetical protein FQR65_LT20613 [Abscondita terminalis]